MALHILPQESGFGEALGSGLGTGLQALAQLKLNQLTQRAEQSQFSQALQKIPGITPEVAQFAAALPPDVRKYALQNLGSLTQLGQLGQQQAQQASTGFTPQRAQQMNPMEQAAQAPQESAPLLALQGLLKGKTGSDLITNPLTSDAVRNAMSKLQLGEQVGKVPGGLEALLGQTQQQQVSPALQAQAAAQQSFQPTAVQQAKPNQPAIAADILKDIFTSPEEKRRQKLLEIEEKKLALQERKAEKKTPAELKHADAVNTTYDYLKDMVDTTDRMLKNLEDPELNLGIMSTIKAGTFPTLLNTATEQYDKDANHIFNLSSSGQKGVLSNFRATLLKKEKPGVEHSKSVNKQIVTRANREAKAKLKSLQNRYPDLTHEAQKAYGEEAATRSPSKPQDLLAQAQSSPLEYPQFYQERSVYQDDSGKKYVLSNGQWKGVAA